MTESNDPSLSQSGKGLRYQSSPSTNSAPTQEDGSGSSPVSIPVVRINTPLGNTKPTCDTYSGVDGSNIYLEMKQWYHLDQFFPLFVFMFVPGTIDLLVKER